MSSRNELMAKEATIATNTATNANAVATVTALADSVVSTTYVTGIIISASAAIAAPVEATVTGLVGGTLKFELPAAQIAPVVLLFGVHPLRATPGTNVVLTVPALGASVVGSATLLYHYGAI